MAGSMIGYSGTRSVVKYDSPKTWLVVLGENHRLVLFLEALGYITVVLQHLLPLCVIICLQNLPNLTASECASRESPAVYCCDLLCMQGTVAQHTYTVHPHQIKLHRGTITDSSGKA